MSAITIDPANAAGRIDIPLSTVRDLRLVQCEGITFEEAWARRTAFQPHGLSRAQARCFWELVAFDTTQQTSEFETLLELGCTCNIESDGVSWVDFDGKELRFTPADRLSVSIYAQPRYQYLYLLAAAIRGVHPDD